MNLENAWREVSCIDCGTWFWSNKNVRRCELCTNCEHEESKRLGKGRAKSFQLIYDPSPPDCAFTYKGMFDAYSVKDASMAGCIFKNLSTGEIVKNRVKA